MGVSEPQRSPGHTGVAQKEGAERVYDWDAAER